MACQFDITLKEAPEVYLEKAGSAIAKLKGTFTGDAQAGTLAVNTPIGDVRAAYHITNGNQMHINVVEKPFFLSCDKIKTLLREYIG